MSNPGERPADPVRAGHGDQPDGQGKHRVRNRRPARSHRRRQGPAPRARYRTHRHPDLERRTGPSRQRSQSEPRPTPRPAPPTRSARHRRRRRRKPSSPPALPTGKTALRPPSGVWTSNAAKPAPEAPPRTDPSRRPTGTTPATSSEPTCNTNQGRINAIVRRVPLDPQRTRHVREFTTHLTVLRGPGITEQDVADLQQDAQRALDEHINIGYLLPSSGDQLHATVIMTPGPKTDAYPDDIDEGLGQGLLLLTRSGDPVPLQQHHWDLDVLKADQRDTTQYKLLHELAHWQFGLNDAYVDPGMLLRRTDTIATGRNTDTTRTRIQLDGLMATTTGLHLLPRHIHHIETISDLVLIRVRFAGRSAESGRLGGQPPQPAGR
jgi:hypothetical protein